ncbi:pilus assembly protein [Oxalobacteraceae bacterium]|nr:pilus assembly protein [Oxalobacteraceae bacterium]
MAKPTSGPLLSRRGIRPRQQGIAAVEFALMLAVLIFLLAFPLYFGRLFYHYGAAINATHNAARYLSAIPLIDMKNTTRAPGEVALARLLVQEHLSQFISEGTPYSVSVQCDGINCAGFTAPTTVTVATQFVVDDLIFPQITMLSIPMTAKTTIPYVGR